MNQTEWNKCFLWLCALYPNWNPNALVTSAWFDEFGKKVSPDEFKSSVRFCMKKNPSAFPPGIAEILSAYTALINPIIPSLAAKEDWQRVLGRFKSNGSDRNALSNTGRKALKLIGGINTVGQTLETELKWLEKSFVATWLECHESQKLHGDSLALNGREALMIGGLANAFTMEVPREKTSPQTERENG